MDTSTYFSTILSYAFNALRVLAPIVAFTTAYASLQVLIFYNLEKYNFIRDHRSEDDKKHHPPPYVGYSVLATFLTCCLVIGMTIINSSTFWESEHWYRDFVVVLAQPYFLALVIEARLLVMGAGAWVVCGLVRGAYGRLSRGASASAGEGGVELQGDDGEDEGEKLDSLICVEEV